ncbi:MAG: cupin domain-containing protein [Promethearchaeota archaeon]|nr:MAG: cupin domain-containing protein [Candidatus Lokiarchaeota archaeon]
MKIIEVKNIPIAYTPHKVDVRKLISYEHATVVCITLKKGEGLKLHKTPVDVCFYILEGKGIVEIGNEAENVKKDQLIFSPAKIPHRLKNNSNGNFRFLVIKTPTPTTETKML